MLTDHMILNIYTIFYFICIKLKIIFVSIKCKILR